MINEIASVNGRRINLISLDDGYSPPKTVEQTRRLVEQEQVAFIFRSLGTPTNNAIRQYLNDNKVPQLFIASGAVQFSDPLHFPGPWVSSRTSGRRRVSTPGTSWRPSGRRRSALSERQFRQGLSDRLEGWARPRRIVVSSAPRRPRISSRVCPSFAGAKATVGADVERQRPNIEVAPELEGLVGRECAVGGESVDRIPSTVQRAIR
jgi:hypothetical protein